MRKLVAVGVVTFACGAAMAAFAFVNPFDWAWLGAPSMTSTAERSESRERAVKYWQAPMDPTYIRNEPGKSPMGMDLIPVYEDEVEEPAAGTVRIDPTFVQNIGVQTEPVRRTDIPFTIRTVGNVTYNDQLVSWVNTKYEGWIEQVYVNYVGEAVTKGQKLFEVYSPQLVTTQDEYLQAVDYAGRMANSDYPEAAARARALVESARRRLEYWDITAEQIAELERSRTPKRTLAVVSGVDGIVVEKMDQALEGMYVKAGMNLYKIVNLSTVWVEVEIFENQVSWLRVGQRAVVELPYAPGRQYVGRVRYLFPFFENKTRTMKATIELQNPGLTLRAEMYANVTLQVPSAKGVLVVPEEAVLRSGSRNLVVLDRGGGAFQVREVTLGVNGSGLWEVSEGVDEGDQVVVSAQFLIDSESSLKEAIRKMVSQNESAPAEPAAPPMPEHQH
jgi:Cu(I)/Ag(I) efflux system membrane fusion protein/cobalt-zinc-cadmium efflux system membrane fusion protein